MGGAKSKEEQSSETDGLLWSPEHHQPNQLYSNSVLPSAATHNSGNGTEQRISQRSLHLQERDGGGDLLPPRGGPNNNNNKQNSKRLSPAARSNHGGSGGVGGSAQRFNEHRHSESGGTLYSLSSESPAGTPYHNNNNSLSPSSSSPPPAVLWEADEQHRSCAMCAKPFHRLTRWRHHCRKCGHVYCDDCCPLRLTSSVIGGIGEQIGNGTKDKGARIRYHASSSLSCYGDGGGGAGSSGATRNISTLSGASGGSSFAGLGGGGGVGEARRSSSADAAAQYSARMRSSPANAVNNSGNNSNTTNSARQLQRHHHQEVTSTNNRRSSSSLLEPPTSHHVTSGGEGVVGPRSLQNLLHPQSSKSPKQQQQQQVSTYGTGAAAPSGEHYIHRRTASAGSGGTSTPQVVSPAFSPNSSSKNTTNNNDSRPISILKKKDSLTDGPEGAPILSSHVDDGYVKNNNSSKPAKGDELTRVCRGCHCPLLSILTDTLLSYIFRFLRYDAQDRSVMRVCVRFLLALPIPYPYLESSAFEERFVWTEPHDVLHMTTETMVLRCLDRYPNRYCSDVVDVGGISPSGPASPLAIASRSSLRTKSQYGPSSSSPTAATASPTSAGVSHSAPKRCVVLHMFRKRNLLSRRLWRQFQRYVDVVCDASRHQAFPALHEVIQTRQFVCLVLDCFEPEEWLPLQDVLEVVCDSAKNVGERLGKSAGCIKNHHQHRNNNSSNATPSGTRSYRSFSSAEDNSIAGGAAGGVAATARRLPDMMYQIFTAAAHLHTNAHVAHRRWSLTRILVDCGNAIYDNTAAAVAHTNDNHNNRIPPLSPQLHNGFSGGINNLSMHVNNNNSIIHHHRDDATTTMSATDDEWDHPYHNGNISTFEVSVVGLRHCRILGDGTLPSGISYLKRQQHQRRVAGGAASTTATSGTAATNNMSFASASGAVPSNFSGLTPSASSSAPIAYLAKFRKPPPIPIAIDYNLLRMSEMYRRAAEKRKEALVSGSNRRVAFGAAEPMVIPVVVDTTSGLLVSSTSIRLESQSLSPEMQFVAQQHVVDDGVMPVVTPRASSSAYLPPEVRRVVEMVDMIAPSLAFSGRDVKAWDLYGLGVISAAVLDGYARTFLPRGEDRDESEGGGGGGQSYLGRWWQSFVRSDKEKKKVNDARRIIATWFRSSVPICHIITSEERRIDDDPRAVVSAAVQLHDVIQQSLLLFHHRMEMEEEEKQQQQQQHASVGITATAGGAGFHPSSSSSSRHQHADHVVILSPAFYSAMLAWSTLTLKLLSPHAAQRSSVSIESLVSHMLNISRTLTLTFMSTEPQQTQQQFRYPQHRPPTAGAPASSASRLRKTTTTAAGDPPALLTEWCPACRVSHSLCPMPPSQLRSSHYESIVNRRHRNRHMHDAGSGGNCSSYEDNSSDDDNNNSDTSSGNGSEERTKRQQSDRLMRHLQERLRQQQQQQEETTIGGAVIVHDEHAPPPPPRHTGPIRGFRRNPAASPQREED